MKKYIAYFLCMVCCSCGTIKLPYYNSNAENWEERKVSSGKPLLHTLFLVGDSGDLDSEQTNHVLISVSKDLQDEVSETSLVYLGDNIYPKGLSSINADTRSEEESILNAQLNLANDHQGTTYFIPGNHDWNKYSAGGKEAIQRQQAYVTSYFDNDEKVKLYPKNACGDPKVVKIHKDLVFIFIDTQWWLQDWSNESKMNEACDVKSRNDFIKRMQEIFVDHKNDEIVVLMHHPIYSNGKHGGKFNLRHHLFPLTEMNKNLWIPLPIIGSMYPGHRMIIGSKQDIPHVQNKALMQELRKMATLLRINVIFASGHDHGLQYFDDDRLKYIISGAGAKNDFVKKGGNAEFARGKRGYVKLQFYEDFEAWVEFYVLNDNNQAILEYKKQIRTPRAGTVEEEVKYPKITEKTITIAANEKFKAKKVKKFFLGEQYRDIWATPVEAEIIDLETKLGGLTPIKKGGGMASNSLRMQKENGKQYILRSIKKDYTKLVPPEFSNLKLLDVLADQNSASHPYNALIIPKLSKEAGVYYTDPKLVYLKHQKGLGNYNSQFPEELYLLEERPTGDWSDESKFGNSEKIIGYTDLLNILREKKNHFIDQKWVCKSRIFDLLIHDWDRHDDQWRWASFKEDGKNIYRPIPRDRDQAFYKFVGVVPSYIAAFMQKKFKSMKHDLKDVKNHSFNARNFDRYFMNQLEWSDWEVIVNQVQQDLTDEEIDEAINAFPKEIMSLNDDEELASKLKSRKQNLKEIAKKLYDFLAQEVEVTGTDDKNRFEITRNEESVTVLMYVLEKNGPDLLKFERTFYSNETKEIRLYGLRDDDSFIMNGTSNNKIKIRIIGGEGDDNVINNTDENNMIVYDDIKGMNIEGQVKNKTSKTLNVNGYDRNGFQYNTNLPILTFGSTVDDGFWIGAAINWTIHGWRKDPYKSKQFFSASFAPGGQDALQLAYSGQFPNSIGSLDFAPSISVRFPHYENYFGLGNETKNPLKETEFHWVRMQDIDIEPLVRYGIGETTSIDFGPLYRYRNVNVTNGRVSTDEDLGFENEDFDDRNYLGGIMRFTTGSIDNSVFPANGLVLNSSFNAMKEINKDEVVAEFTADAQFYFQLAVKPKLVFANNFGYQKSFGDLQFYQYPDIGTSRGLRGFRNERFRGESAFYHNLDLRLKLFNWNNTFIPMDIGVVGGFDYGKVFIENQDSQKRHSSVTAGIYFELLGAVIIHPYYSITDEENVFALSVGFSF